MKLRIKHAAYLLLMVVCIGCQEEEVTARNFPRLSTLEVTNISNEGARFNAEFTARGNFEILNYGFTWGQNQSPTIEVNDRIVFQGNIEANDFNARIETTLRVNTVYYVRAFVRTNDFLVYGDAVAFISLGSKAPKIDSFQPISAAIGDTIMIFGQNFSFVTSKNEVSFDDQESNVLMATDSTLQVLVPLSLDKPLNDLAVSIEGNKAFADDKFELALPVINTVSPATGTDFDLLTITGERFTAVSNQVEVSIGGRTAELISNSESELKVTVPSGLTKKDNEVEITIYNQEISWSSLFRMKAPELIGFEPANFQMRDTITIRGANFNTNFIRNQVIIGDKSMRVVGGSADSLRVVISAAPNEDQGRIEVVNVEQNAQSPNEFFFIPPQILTQSPFRVRANEEITLETQNLSPNRQDHSLVLDGNELTINSYDPNFLKFEIPSFDLEISRFPTLELVTNDRSSSIELELLNPWIKRTSIPCEASDCGRNGAVGFSYDRWGFMGLGNNPGLNRELWRYDTENNSWEQMADFPGVGRFNATSFVINNFAYVGGGQSYSTNEALQDFYKYDLVNDVWSQIRDFPYPLSSATGLSNGEKGFVATTEVEENFWSYNPISDNWTQEADLDIASSDSKVDSGFELNGQLYYYVYGIDRVNENNVSLVTELHRFDPLSTTWTRLADLPVNSSGYGRSTGFSLNASGYIISQNGRGLYRYDPNSDNWKRFNTANAVLFRFVNASVFTVDGKAYYGGGIRPSGAGLNDGLWEYDPSYEDE